MSLVDIIVIATVFVVGGLFGAITISMFTASAIKRAERQVNDMLFFAYLIVYYGNEIVYLSNAPEELKEKLKTEITNIRDAMGMIVH